MSVISDFDDIFPIRFKKKLIQFLFLEYYIYRRKKWYFQNVSVGRTFLVRGPHAASGLATAGLETKIDAIGAMYTFTRTLGMLSYNIMRP